MKQICSLLVVIALSCLSGCHEETGVCYDSKKTVSLSIISTSDIDSVQFYLNNQRICIGNTGANQKMIMCKVKSQNASEIMTLMLLDEVDLNKCERSENMPIWTAFDCFINGELDAINVDSSKLIVSIFSNDDKTDIETKTFNFGGSQVNVIPEQDTILWFGYKENPAIPRHEAFENPARSIRKGCSGGFCTAMFQMDQKEFCYDN